MGRAIRIAPVPLRVAKHSSKLSFLLWKACCEKLVEWCCSCCDDADKGAGGTWDQGVLSSEYFQQDHGLVKAGVSGRPALPCMCCQPS